jgi:hypothetical protein
LTRRELCEHRFGHRALGRRSRRFAREHQRAARLLDALLERVRQPETERIRANERAHFVGAVRAGSDLDRRLRNLGQWLQNTRIESRSKIGVFERSDSIERALRLCERACARAFRVVACELLYGKRSRAVNQPRRHRDGHLRRRNARRHSQREANDFDVSRRDRAVGDRRAKHVRLALNDGLSLAVEEHRAQHVRRGIDAGPRLFRPRFSNQATRSRARQDLDPRVLRVERPGREPVARAGVPDDHVEGHDLAGFDRRAVGEKHAAARLMRHRRHVDGRGPRAARQ